VAEERLEIARGKAFRVAGVAARRVPAGAIASLGGQPSDWLNTQKNAVTVIAANRQTAHDRISIAGTMPRATPVIVLKKFTATRTVTRRVPMKARKLTLLSLMLAV
jgi:hypothetical protein